MWAAAEGHGNAVKALVEAGADPNIASKRGFAALAFAATRNEPDSVRALLNAGADTDRATSEGSSPAGIAASYGHSETLGLLVDAGADIATPDDEGRTPLYLAARAGDAKSVSLLLAAGADPDRRTAAVESFGSNRDLRRPDGEDTPLLAAALGGHLDIMRLLVRAGADPKARTQDGATLLMQASRSVEPEVVEYAYSLDSDITARTTIGRGVMHAAVMLKAADPDQDVICAIIRFLAQKGADPDPIDEGGRTAISTADVWPLEKASMLLYELTLAAGREPKILPTDLR